MFTGVLIHNKTAYHYYQHPGKDNQTRKKEIFEFRNIRIPATGADLLVSPEMKSTGEVMGIASNFAMAFAKSQSAAKNSLPKSGKVFISLCDLDKPFAATIAKSLVESGFTIAATGGTEKIITEAGIACEKVLKVSEGRPNITDLLTNGDIAMAINTGGEQESSKDDGKEIRRAVLRMSVPYFTTVAAAFIVTGKLLV